MSLPKPDELRGLLAIEPRLGVLSVCLRIDHADRRAGWRIALRDALHGAISQAGDDPDRERALRATADRIQDRFAANGEPPEGRGQVGFVEISAEPGDDRWWSSSAQPREDAVAVAGRRPYLQPLIQLLDDHRRRGVVAVSGERARLLEWEQGALSELDAREILTTGDWRERKAPRNVDVPSGQATTSSGRDQHEQRIEDHRRRFVDGIATEVATVADRRGWREIICFGEPKYLSEFESRLGSDRIAFAEDKNLIPEPEHGILERLETIAPQLDRRRELGLIDAAEQAAREGGRGSLGLTETAQALAEGRVEHLLIAASGLPDDPGELGNAALASGIAPGSIATGELLIERALQTDAAVTTVEGEAADRLAALGAAAAVLRY
jgi:Bacterial archaeo-eukaryotic release factor family 10